MTRNILVDPPPPCVIWWHCRKSPLPLECHVLFEWPLIKRDVYVQIWNVFSVTENEIVREKKRNSILLWRPLGIITKLAIYGQGKAFISLFLHRSNRKLVFMHKSELSFCNSLHLCNKFVSLYIILFPSFLWFSLFLFFLAFFLFLWLFSFPLSICQVKAW